ncbi:MAG: hypothetical protein GC206_10110 [Alphaproteobacteria bacterium]|nr:hypothetical protein [Alphaproteobacteria bacterium]
MIGGSLAMAVQKRIKEAEDAPLFDDAVVEAMRLADRFEAVKAEEYVLPLDALAGFRVIPAQKAAAGE